MMKKMLAMLMAMLMLCGVAFAEETNTRAPGDLIERGLVFPMTEADGQELYLSLTFAMAYTSEVNNLPIANFNYMDYAGLEKTMLSYTEEDLQDEETMMEALVAFFDHNHIIYSIILFPEAYYDEQIAAGRTAADLLEAPNAVELGKNDGYVYVGLEQYDDLLAAMTTDEQKAAAQKAVDRCSELIAGATFQPIVFAEGDFTEVVEGALAFTTQDLNGNTVTQDLFAGKELTVLNVWGTFCEPCISEMPELAEWSQNMPEGVQLVGLVSDVRSADNADGVETAQMICEATGANVYTHLIANADFDEMLAGMVGVPTTFFVDGNGVIVGDPVSGVNVAACKSFVEEYMAE